MGCARAMQAQEITYGPHSARAALPARLEGAESTLQLTSSATLGRRGMQQVGNEGKERARWNMRHLLCCLPQAQLSLGMRSGTVCQSGRSA